MQACNYDFAHDNSHSSDLNVVSPLCEDNIFDEVLSLHLEREREIELSIYTRELPTPRPHPHPPARSRLPLTLAAGRPYQAGDKYKELEE